MHRQPPTCSLFKYKLWCFVHAIQTISRNFFDFFLDDSTENSPFQTAQILSRRFFFCLYCKDTSFGDFAQASLLKSCKKQLFLPCAQKRPAVITAGRSFHVREGLLRPPPQIRAETFLPTWSRWQAGTPPHAPIGADTASKSLDSAHRPHQ